jgi:hypothetical protein
VGGRIAQTVVALQLEGVRLFENRELAFISA